MRERYRGIGSVRQECETQERDRECETHGQIEECETQRQRDRESDSERERGV